MELKLKTIKQKGIYIMFAHIASAIHAQDISPRSTLTPEVIADLIDNFHKRDLSVYRGGEFVSIGELILYGNGRKDMTVEVMVDRKAEFVFANFEFDGCILSSEVWQYTRKTTFEVIYKHHREDWFDLSFPPRRPLALAMGMNRRVRRNALRKLSCKTTKLLV